MPVYCNQALIRRTVQHRHGIRPVSIFSAVALRIVKFWSRSPVAIVCLSGLTNDCSNILCESEITIEKKQGRHPHNPRQSLPEGSHPHLEAIQIAVAGKATIADERDP